MVLKQYALRSKRAWLYFILLIIADAVSALPVLAAESNEYALKELLDLPLQDLLQLRVSVASRFSESPLETGSTTSVIERSQWHALGARRFKDALDMQPGLIVLPDWFGAEPVYIRGYAEHANTNGVAMLLDGVALNLLEGSAQFTRQNVNLGVLDRIEVIRGPGSALYGDTAFHGVLDLHSFESDQDLALFDLSYAGNGYRDSAINYSRGFGRHRINLALANSGQTAQNQAYEYIDSNGKVASSERDLIFNTTTLILKWDSQINSHSSTYLNVYWDDNRYDDFYSRGTTAYFDGSTVAADDTGGVDSQFAMFQIGGHLQLKGKRDLAAKIFRNKSKRVFTQKIAHNAGHILGSSAKFAGIGELTGNGDGEYSSGVNVTLKQDRVRNWRWSLDLSSKRTHMGDFTNTQTDANGDYWVNPGGIVFNNASLAFSDFKRITNGIGLDSTTYLANDALLLKLGGRYDRYSDFGNVFSPRAASIYKLNKEQSLKLNYGRAFRAPAAGELKGYANSAENPELGAETIDTFEVSYNSQSKNLIQEHTLFKSYWRDAITYVGPKYDNSGLSSAYGAESSITYQVNNWQLLANMSYVRSRNDQTLTEYVAFPKWIINAGISHLDKSSNTHWQINNRVHLGAREGQINTVSLPHPRPLKDYWRTDVHISRPWNEQASMSLDVRNLFNRENYLPSIQEEPSTGGLPDEERSLRIAMHFIW